MKLPPEEQAPHTIKFQLPTKQTAIKLGKLGTAVGTLGGVVVIIVNIAFFEPQFTPKTNARIDKHQIEINKIKIDIVEKTKGVPSNKRLLEIEGKTRMLAKVIDEVEKAMVERVHGMEIRLMNKMDEKSLEIVRLVVAGINKHRNGEAE